MSSPQYAALPTLVPLHGDSEGASVPAKGARFSVFDWVALSTVLVLFRNSHGALYFALAVIIGIAMLIRPGLRRSPIMYLTIVAIWIPRLALHWYENEDHVYLGIYWCAAVALSLLGRPSVKVLATNARYLIALSMGIAFLWKVVIPDFGEGSVFEYNLLFDHRFREVVTLPLGGLDPTSAQFNIDQLKQLRHQDHQPASVTILVPLKTKAIAKCMAWWTIFIEGYLAVAFLLPRGTIHATRNFALIAFMTTTYLVVPVMGFATIFCAMGFAQCRRYERQSKWAYVLTLIILTLALSIRFSVLPPPS